MTDRISAAEARALALAAQGLATPRPAAVDARALRQLATQLGAIQIDSVNVVARSHYLPAFSRLGAYDRDALDALSSRAPRALFEYWGHMASLLPVALYPLLRWRMAEAHLVAWGRIRKMARHGKALIAEVLALVRERGPIAASDIELGKPKARAGWWEWSEAKVAIEYLFWAGEVTSARRRGFERLYDLPERVIPAAIRARPTPSPADAHRQLIERAAAALGVATETDLRDYYRLGPKLARQAIADAVEAGTLIETAVEGWTGRAARAYRHARSAAPPAIDPARAALLSPFDSLIWTRDRTERLFDMAFRLEIYTPAHRRKHGYYVLPFLLGDRLVARVDLKADREAGELRVHAAHAEPGAAPRAIAPALAAELARLARWLGLERTAVTRAGNLAAALAGAVRLADT